MSDPRSTSVAPRGSQNSFLGTSNSESKPSQEDLSSLKTQSFLGEESEDALLKEDSKDVPTQSEWPRDRLKAAKFVKNLQMTGKCHLTHQFHSCSSYEDFMFVYGGWNGAEPVKELSCFHFSTHSWSTIQSDESKAGRYGHSALVFGDRLFIFGGKTSSGPTDELLEFKFERQSWNSISGRGSRPPPRHGHSVVLWEGKMYLFGGAVGPNESPSNDIFEFIFDTLTWNKLTPTGSAPPPRFYHSSVVHKDSMYVFGGYDGTENLLPNILFQLNLKTKVWTALNVANPLPTSRYHHRAIAFESSMYLVGGVTKDNNNNNRLQVFEFDFDFRKWFRLIPRGDVAEHREAGDIAVRGNCIFLLGGVKDRISELEYFVVGPEDDFEKDFQFDETTKMKNTSKAFWEATAMKKHPDVLELRERLRPLSGLPSYGRKPEVAKTEASTSVDSKMVLQLIMEWLFQEPALKGVVETIEQESKVHYNERDYVEIPDLVTVLSLGKRSLGHKSIFAPDITFEDRLETVDPELPNVDHLPSRLDTSKSDVNLWTEVDSDENIIIEKTEKGEIIKASNLNKIIQKLTAEKDKVQDLQLIRAILYSHTSFTTSQILLKKLIQRYNVPPQKLSSSDVQQIRAKICTVIKFWIDKVWWDFDEKLLSALNEFIDGPLSRDGNLSSVKQLRGAITKLLKKKSMGVGHAAETLSINIPEPKVPPASKLFSKTLNIGSMDEVEVARQMTLIDFELFQRITAPQLLNRAWLLQKHKAKVVIETLKRQETVRDWVASLVLDPKNDKPKTRAKMIEKLIRIAEALKGLKNFQTLFAVLSGLKRPQVRRLSLTMAEINPRVKSLWEELDNLISPNDDWINYRNVLKASERPALPYISVILDDILRIEEKMDDFTNGLINIEKKFALFHLISSTEEYQSREFQFFPVHQMQQYLIEMPELLSAQELTELSVKHEKV